MPQASDPLLEIGNHPDLFRVVVRGQALIEETLKFGTGSAFPGGPAELEELQLTLRVRLG